MGFLDFIFGKKIINNTQDSHNLIDELIKKSTSEFKKGNNLEAIQLIKKAIQLADIKSISMYDKLANYQYKSNLKEDAFKTLDLMIECEIIFIAQFSYDIPKLNRLNIWEKDKVMKEKYEAIITIKTFIDYCMSGNYKNYPLIQKEFKDCDVQKEYDNYINKTRTILLAINEEVKLVLEDYNENYLEKYNHLSNKSYSIYEKTNELIKNHKQITHLTNQLKNIPFPYDF